jgi:hypothetical protein
MTAVAPPAPPAPLPAPPLSRPVPPSPRPRTEAHRGAPPAKPRTAVAFDPIPGGSGHRIVAYGPGGIGKTMLATTAPGPVAFFDLDDSLGIIRMQLPAEIQQQLNRVGNISRWQDIRDALHLPGWDPIRTIVIDSATRAEELAVEHTLATVPHEKGHRVQRIEDYGFGKGYSHVYDTFLPLLGDLDQHARGGRNVILICHDCTASVPNPNGEDWIRYEPRLQSPSSGKSSIRLRVREWADHVLFIGYDIDVHDGKAKGTGTRTIFPNELPHCMAKSRTLSQPLPLAKFDLTLWSKLFGAPQSGEQPSGEPHAAQS